MHKSLLFVPIVIFSLLVVASILFIQMTNSPTPSDRVTAQSTGLNCQANSGRLTCFEAWRLSFTTGVYTADADMNISGTVTMSDFEVWRRAYTGT